MFEHGMHDEDDDLMLDEEHNEHDVHDEDDNLLLEEHDDEPNLLLHSVRHQLLLGALRADDVLPVRDEALAHHAGLAGGADEAVVVPVPALEGDEPRAADSSDGFAASCAPLGEQLAETIRTVRLVIAGGEPLPCQGLLAVCAGEALPVPGIVPVGHSTLGDHLAALDALCSKLLLIALGAVDVVFLGYEALGADGVLAGTADEALLVPLPGLVLHLLHTSLEDVPTAVAPGGELCVVAGTTVDPVSLGPELLVHQARPALVTEEAGLMPVLLLVGQVLGVDPDDLPALVAVIREHILVTLDTVGVIVPQNISVSSKTVVAVMAEHGVVFLSFVSF